MLFLCDNSLVSNTWMGDYIGRGKSSHKCKYWPNCVDFELRVEFWITWELETSSQVWVWSESDCISPNQYPSGLYPPDWEKFRQQKLKRKKEKKRNVLGYVGFPGGSDGRESACNARDPGLIPGSGWSPGEGNGYSLQYSCLENSIDRGAWQAVVHEVM